MRACTPAQRSRLDDLGLYYKLVSRNDGTVCQLFEKDNNKLVLEAGPRDALASIDLALDEAEALPAS